MKTIKRLSSIILIFTFIMPFFTGISVQALEKTQSDLTDVYEENASLHLIMGKGSLPKEKMMSILRKNNTSLSNSYIEKYVNYVIEEANAEGVNYDVVFGLTMLETSYLRFGGDVKSNQNNFGGLGATGNGNPGLSFSSVQIGVRAVVQHLKAYGSTEALNKACVDPRFVYVQRGCAKYVEWLGIHENPYGKGWASGYNYGKSILSVIEQTKSIVSYEPSKISSLTLSGSKILGNELTIKANLTSEVTSLYKFTVYDVAESKIVHTSDWQKSNIFKYTPKKVGKFTFKIYAKNQSSIASYDSYKSVSANIVQFKPAKINNIIVSGGNVVGKSMSIKVDAEPNDDNLYRYVLIDKATKESTVIKSWTSSTQISYIVNKASDYWIRVYAKNKLSPNSYDDYKHVSHKVTMVSVISDVKVNEYQKVGETITIEATATPADSTLYKYTIKELATGKIVLNSSWSTNKVCKYTPTIESKYVVYICVKNKYSTTTGYDDRIVKMVNVISHNRVKIIDYVFLGTDKANERSSVTLIASETKNVLYKFVMRNNATNEDVIVRDWSTNNVMNYGPIKPGTYTIYMYAKSRASNLAYDNKRIVTKVITPVRSKINSINVTGEKKVGKAITIDVDATQSKDTYYKIYITNIGTKETKLLVHLKKINKVDFIPTKAGTYEITVKVKNRYSDTTCDDTRTQKIVISANKLIVIDPGHGGSDPGAISGGYIEKNMNLKLSLAIRKSLIDYGYDVEMTRITDVYVELNDRAMIANNKNADLCISVHHNSFTSSSAYGTEVYYTTEYMDSNIRNKIIAQGKKDPNTTHTSKVSESKKLSDKFAPLLSSATGLYNRGSKAMNLCVGRNTYMPFILLEAGFITNSTDASTVSKESVQENIADNLTKAIVQCGY